MSHSHTVSTPRSGSPVFLSASLPDQLRGTTRCQDLFDFLVPLVNGILSSGGMIVFGGHPTMTPLIHQICIAHNFTGGRVALFQHRRFESEAPPQVQDTNVFDTIWMGDQTASSDQFDEELGAMRKQMVDRAKAAVFIGGRTSDYVGKEPGIVQEYQLFCGEAASGSGHRPGRGYLVGLLDGQVARIIRDNESKNQREHNGLSQEELDLLHHSDDPDLVVGIILADLLRGSGSP